MKPSLPKGTRDFLPAELARRKYIFNTIESVFEVYGYQGIETPAMENLSSLLGKYGDEGDKLLFKVLNNGDYLAKADEDALAAKDSDRLTPSIARRGLRYDLTVPFARFVVMNQNEIQFPFKRYQIQPVWRADRPQKGRYQEFFQCDADVLGSDSLSYEAELIQIYDRVFGELKLPVVIKLNNRKVLTGLAESIGMESHFSAMTTAIDKLDKIGWDGVHGELKQVGFSDGQREKLQRILELTQLDDIAARLADTPSGAQGIRELQTVFDYLSDYGMANRLELDMTLARGLSYYTGCILEVKARDMAYGSIGGGGRYDDLTGIFGMPGNSGVGISFGADRIYDVLLELGLFPEGMGQSIRLLFVAMDDESHRYAFNAMTRLRSAGITCDLYPEPTKMKKQMKYADGLGVPFVAIVGESERELGVFSVKNMQTGEQTSCKPDDLVQLLQAR
jgi:histidyl-tRNA synthetase